MGRWFRKWVSGCQVEMVQKVSVWLSGWDNSGSLCLIVRVRWFMKSVIGCQGKMIQWKSVIGCPGEKVQEVCVWLSGWADPGGVSGVPALDHPDSQAVQRAAPCRVPVDCGTHSYPVSTFFSCDQAWQKPVYFGHVCQPNLSTREHGTDLTTCGNTFRWWSPCTYVWQSTV